MSLVTLPRQFLVDSSGAPRVGAKLYAYQAGTTTPITTYTTTDYAIAHAHPVVSLAGGLFPAVYVNPGVNETYKIVVTDSADVTLYTEDNIPARGPSATPRYDQTPAEQSAGVTPSDYSKEPGHLFRYGGIGNGTADDTTAFSSCLLACSGAPYLMHVPKPASKYKVDSLAIPSNLSMYIEGGTEIEANEGFTSLQRLFDLDGSSNVRIECNGAIFRLLISEYGATDEHRHTFGLTDCTNVHISDPVVEDAGGDGYYINGAVNLRLDSPKSSGHRRNGISFIKADGVKITGIAEFNNGLGIAALNAAGLGIDFEPNSAADSLKNITIETVKGHGNAGRLVSIYLDDYKTGSPEDVQITIGRIISRDNEMALRVRHVFLNSGSYGGYIDIGEVVSLDERENAVFIQDKASNGPFLHIGKITAVNPCTGASVTAEVSGLHVSDTSNCTSGGIHIDSVSVKATHTDMDWGVYVDMGQGFSDTRIGVSNVEGAQVAPIRFNNAGAASADASNIIVDYSKLRGELALTANTTLTAEAHNGGRIITNTGATGTILLTLSTTSISPKGNPYRFRVTAAQQITIDVSSGDRILGTSADGQTITCSTVGEECELHFVGSIGGVRYWQARILGSPSNWTFN